MKHHLNAVLIKELKARFAAVRDCHLAGWNMQNRKPKEPTVEEMAADLREGRYAVNVDLAVEHLESSFCSDVIPSMLGIVCMLRYEQAASNWEQCQRAFEQMIRGEEMRLRDLVFFANEDAAEVLERFAKTNFTLEAEEGRDQ